jgi:hypothetical protein
MVLQLNAEGLFGLAVIPLDNIQIITKTYSFILVRINRKLNLKLLLMLIVI